jgi:hypothetical protein
VLTIAPLRVVDCLSDRVHEIARPQLWRLRPGRRSQRCQVVIERVIRHSGSIPIAWRCLNDGAVRHAEFRH